MRWGFQIVLGVGALALANRVMVWRLSSAPDTEMMREVLWGEWELGPEHPETDQMHSLLLVVGEKTGAQPDVTLSMITGDVPDPQIDLALAQELIYGTETEQLWAVELMAEMGSRGVRLAQEILKENGEEGALAVSVLARALPEADAVPAMLALMDEAPRVRAMACLELGRLGERSALEQVSAVADELAGTPAGTLAMYARGLLGEGTL